MEDKRPLVLVEVLPDLARALDRLLQRQGLTDLAATIPSLRVHSIGGDGCTIYLVPPESIERPPPNKHAAADRATWSYMYHPARKRHWLGKVPRKRWVLVAEEIDGQLAVLEVGETAGALKEQLKALGRSSDGQ